MENNMKEITMTEILRASNLATKSENNTKAYKTLINKIDNNLKNGYKAFYKGHLNNECLIIDNNIFFGTRDFEKVEVKEKEKFGDTEKEIITEKIVDNAPVGYKTEKKIFEAMIKNYYLELYLINTKQLENDWRSYWATLMSGINEAKQNKIKLGASKNDDIMNYWIKAQRPLRPSIFKYKKYNDLHSNSKKMLNYPRFLKRFDNQEERQEFINKVNEMKKLNEKIKIDTFNEIKADYGFQRYSHEEIEGYYNKYYQTFKAS